MSSLLNDLVGKAQSLLNDFVTRSTNVYDASKNRIIISGLTLDGVVSATISSQVTGTVPESVDEAYFAFYDTWGSMVLQVELLPTAKAVDALQGLHRSQAKYKGYCGVTLTENGSFIGSFKGYITQLPSVVMKGEADNKTFEFTLWNPVVYGINTTAPLEGSAFGGLTMDAQEDNTTMSETKVNQV